MKKVLAFLMVVLIITLCGCTNNSAVTNNGGENMVDSVPESVNLTVDNIENYIVFSTNISEPDVHEPKLVSNCMSIKMKFTVKTASLQNVQFENLKISFKVVPEPTTVGYGWDEIYLPNTNTEFSGALNIPYDGVWEESFKIQSQFIDYVTDNPNLKIVVTSVSGKAIIK